ncbi:MAG: transposase [Ardenticatenaceae bacterium]
MKLRSQIERIIAGVVLNNGGRRARSRGIAKAGFQAKMNAMAYNIKRWMKLLGEKENPPKEKSSRSKYDLPAVTNS